MQNTLEMIKGDFAQMGVDVFVCPLHNTLAISSRDGYVGVSPQALSPPGRFTSVLCHESGHFLSNQFYLAYSPYELREQAECRAARAAYNRYIPYRQLLSCMQSGLTTQWELAEYFGVTQQDIFCAYTYYKDVLGYSFHTDITE